MYDESTQRNCLHDPTVKCCADTDPAEECTALTKFYANASKGDGWLLKQNWLTGVTFCSFHGISCDADGHVEKIDLPGNGLQGIIDPSIFTDCKHLVEFNIATNKYLGGPVPKEIGQASNLCLFEAYQCNLTGILPDVFSNLTHFNTAYCAQPKLDLHFNNLNGPLPPSIGNMDGLPYISIANNAFTGSIPLSWFNLLKLTTLGIAFNPLLNGTLDIIGSLPSLSVLFARGCSLTGEVPLPKSTKITVMDLDRWVTAGSCYCVYAV